MTFLSSHLSILPHFENYLQYVSFLLPVVSLFSFFIFWLHLLLGTHHEVNLLCLITMGILHGYCCNTSLFIKFTFFYFYTLIAIIFPCFPVRCD